jgi:putative N-acetyltransferase (TIGR04045 family)
MSTISSPSVAERAAAAAADPQIVRDQLVCRVARTGDELAEHFRIRRAIFVDAQALFEHDDRDQHDDDPATLHVVAMTPAGCVGAVRLYPIAGDREWKGDRLAVLATARAHHVGPSLVRCAVAIGGARGGRRMLAYVQRPVVEFFEHLGWAPVGDVFSYCGVDHRRMSIDLRPGAAR